MAKSVRDQLLEQKVVTEAETPEGQRDAARAARPPEPTRELPPLFEAKAKGVIVSSSARPTSVRKCMECGAALPPSRRVDDAPRRCAECSVES